MPFSEMAPKCLVHALWAWRSPGKEVLLPKVLSGVWGETSTDPRGEPQYRGCQTQVPLIFETLKMILKSNLLGSVLLKQHKFIRVYRRDSPDDPVVKNITDLIYIQLLEV